MNILKAAPPSLDQLPDHLDLYSFMFDCEDLTAQDRCAPVTFAEPTACILSQPQTGRRIA